MDFPVGQQCLLGTCRLASLLTPLESRVSSDLGASPVWDKLSLKAFMFPSRTGQVSYQLQLGHSLHRSNNNLGNIETGSIDSQRVRWGRSCHPLSISHGPFQKKGITLKEVKNREVADWKVEGGSRECEEDSWVSVSKAHYVHVCNNMNMS